MADGQGSAPGSGSILDVPLAKKNYNQLSSENTLQISVCREMGAFLILKLVLE